MNAHGAKSGVRSHDSREFRKAGSHTKSVKEYVQYYTEDTKNDCILNRFPSFQKHEIRSSVCQIIEICLDDLLLWWHFEVSILIDLILPTNLRTTASLCFFSDTKYLPRPILLILMQKKLFFFKLGNYSH